MANATKDTNQNNSSEATGLLTGNDRQNGANAEASPQINHSERARRFPHKSLLYRLFMTISAIAGILSALMFATQVASLIVMNGGLLPAVLRIYLMIFSVLFILAELQVDFFLKRVPAFNNWFHRGFLYSFVGVSAMEESFATMGQAYPQLPGVVEYTMALLLKICSVGLTIIGVVYMLLGILCLRGVWESMQRRYQLQMAEATATMDV